MKTALALMLNAIFAPLAANADGGAVLLREASGPFLVTVFAPPAPQAGPVDTSVLVQDRKTGTVTLDAVVNLELHPIPDTNPRSWVRARLGPGKNKLLQAATIDIPVSGWWDVKLFVRRGQEEIVLATKLLIIPASPRLTRLWPLLILPPVSIGLFAIHQTLLHKKSRLPDTRHPSL
jgi:hypothetical protein